MFETDADLRTDYRIILLSEVVSDFRDPAQLRDLFTLATRCLAPGGHLVFNIFWRARPTFPTTRHGSSVSRCTTFFTRSEVETAVAGLPLKRVADDSVYEYESAHLPDGAWPPTGWYANWVSGHDVFGLDREHSPIDMRWLVYRKTAR